MTLSQLSYHLGLPVSHLKGLIARGFHPPWYWPDLHGEPVFEDRYLPDWHDILEIEGVGAGKPLSARLRKTTPGAGRAETG